MKKKTVYYNDYQFYTCYQRNNLKIVEEISNTLQNFLHNIVKIPYSREKLYEIIEKKIAILSSYYSRYMTLAGKEYLLHINTALRKHQQHPYSEYSPSESISSLLKTINELKILKYKQIQIGNPDEIQQEEQRTSFQRERFLTRTSDTYAWLTFFRNNAWFMAPYQDAYIIPGAGGKLHYDQMTGKQNILHNSVSYTIIDFFSELVSPAIKVPSGYILITHNRQSDCFAADTIGKHFVAKKDTMLQRIKPFKKSRHIAKGYVTLGGISYIYLNLEHDSI